MAVLQGLVFTAIAIISVVVTVKTAEPEPDPFCELFQYPGFQGESLRIPNLDEISNVTRLTLSWRNGNSSNSARPLYSVKIPPIAACSVNACSMENFQGNCTRLLVSRKRIRVSRLISFACKCEMTMEASTTESPPRGRAAAGAAPKQETVFVSAADEADTDMQKRKIETEACLKSAEDSEYKRFVKYGKKIIGIGRNYIWNNTELSKVLPAPEVPIVFLKPTSSYLEEGNPIKLPDLGTIFFEIELGVVIGKAGRDIEEDSALDHVAGYVLALDLTAKDFLKKSISKGHPWEIGKGFDTACPVGPFIPKACVPHPHQLQLTCQVNGELRQNASTSGMLFKIPQLIAYISKYFRLEANDVILTGTPDGLGPIKSGDLIQGSVGNNLSKIKFTVQ